MAFSQALPHKLRCGRGGAKLAVRDLGMYRVFMSTIVVFIMVSIIGLFVGGLMLKGR